MSEASAEIARRKFVLSSREQSAFEWLRPLPGEAWKFWETACQARGLDYQTCIAVEPFSGGSYSALPIDHDKHWCWPFPLECKHKVAAERAP